MKEWGINEWDWRGANSRYMMVKNCHLFITSIFVSTTHYDHLLILNDKSNFILIFFSSTRLETRTKESNKFASINSVKTVYSNKCEMKVKLRRD